MSEKSLAGRKALVTGGARGIGAAIAEALMNAGASVMIGDILADLGKETAGRLAKTGARTGFVELNVTDDAQWEKAIAATIATLGGYDILINNAGIEITSLVVDLKAEDLRGMCDVNIVGTGLGMKHAFRAMRPGGAAGAGGAIVNITSISAARASTLRSAYGTSKAGLAHLTKQLAVELASLGIRVNGVAPGPVETAMAKAVHTPQIRADYHDAIPLNRYGLESELANAICFLCGDQASYITGQVLAVDGGFDAAGIGLPTLRGERRNG